MITKSEIKKGLFLISWTVENLNVDRHVVRVDLSSYTCSLLFRKDIVGSILCMGVLNKTTLMPAFPNEFQNIAVKKDDTEQQNMKKRIFSRPNRNGQTFWIWRASWGFSKPTIPTSGVNLNDSIKFEILVDTHVNCPDLLKIRQRLEAVHQVVRLFRENETFSDVVMFKCKNKEIYGHPSVLAASSPVFSAMFQHEFKEKQEKVVEIEDIKPSVFEQLVQYLYIQDTELENVEDVVELLVAADKYCVDSLKRKCGLYLSENLTSENAVRCLILAHLHQVPELTEVALDFIARNVKQFSNRDEDWLELTNYNELTVQVLKRIATRVSVSNLHVQ